LRVALINLNRYLEPPVIPLGVEYVAHYLEREGHEVKVIDLAFAADPETALAEGLRSSSPEVVGFSLRNVDSSLYHDNIFFLDEAAKLISACRRMCGARVVAGGSAFLAGPREVADYIGCDFVVYGPGEKALPALLRYLEQGVSPPRLLGGWSYSFDRDEVPARGRWVDYTPYLKQRGVAGFVTQTGCQAACSFCVEANLPWRPRSPHAVVEELADLREKGCGEFHLCDCEFNQDLDTAKELLKRIAQADLGISWSLYMKPLPHDERLFRLLAETGVSSLTLSVDSRSLFEDAYGLMDLQSAIVLAQREGIGVAVDLLVGFPGESLEELRDVFDFFREVRPKTVGVSAWLRVFKYTGLGVDLRTRRPVTGVVEGDDPDYVRPVYYSWMSLEDCRELIDGDPLFRIEGLERRSNYERLS
jgi:radical SAM superfamily enzyme YgiQ (UPF0313 family)